MHQPDLAGRNRLSRFGLHGLLIGTMWLIVCVGLVISYRAVLQDRAQEIARAASEQKNMTAMLERHAQYIVAASSSILNRIGERVAEKGMDTISTSKADWDWVRGVAGDLPSVGVLFVADKDGKGRFSSARFGADQPNVLDREYFGVHRDQRGRLHLGEAQVGRATGKSVFTLSKRLEDAEGAFHGVAVTSIELSYFTDFILTFGIGPTSAVSILRDDGSMILRVPDNGAIGKRFPDAEVFTHLPHAAEGSFTGTSPVNGVEQLTYYKRVGELPLVVTVNRAVDEILAPWRERAKWTALTWVGIVVVVGALSAAAMAAMRRDRASSAETARLLAQLAATNDKLGSVLTSVGEGIIGLDRHGTITFLNPAAADLLGWGEAEVLGRDLHALCHHQRADGAPYPAQDCPVLATIADGTVRRVDGDVFRRADGATFPVEFTAAAVRDGGSITGAVVAFRDISERVAGERELQEAKRAAESASRAKSLFLANMSHEIRTPMTAILGMAHLLEQGELNPRERDRVGKIKLSAQSLLGILNDILDFSKVEAGKLELAPVPFNLDALLSGLSAMIGAAAEAKELEVLFRIGEGVPEALIGDDLRMQQVLINLLGNAVKFTEAGQVILSVAAETVAPDHAVLRFSVRDTGIGMSREQVDGIFGAFNQGDASTTRRYGGTGLGLAISSRLVRLMGGALAVESAPGEGSTFSFTIRLPRDRAPARQAPPLAQARHVLICDDNAEAREILYELCRRLGWKAATADGGEQALLAAERFARNGLPFDLVLLDLRMPGMDGVETARRLRRGEAPSAEIIAITAFGSDLQLAPDDRALFDAVVAKPVTTTALKSAVARVSAAAAAAAERRLAGLCILVAEDNELNQEVATGILEQEGAEVLVAGDGAQAVRMLAAAAADGRRVDLVLMDMMMPEMDGMQATQAIRQRPEMRGLPIVAMTANAMPADRERCLAAGMNDHVAKPLDVELLVRAILAQVAADAVAG